MNCIRNGAYTHNHRIREESFNTCFYKSVSWGIWTEISTTWVFLGHFLFSLLTLFQSVWKLPGRCSYRYSEVGERIWSLTQANFCLNYSVPFTNFIIWCFQCNMEIDVFKNYKFTEFINRIILTLNIRNISASFCSMK